jgi:hypothetical protein
MLINIIDVGQPNTHAAKNGRSYQSMEVTYKDQTGKTSSKKLMSFSNPSVFNAAKNWQKGDSVNVVTQKDDQGYWQWTGIGGDEQVAEQPAKQSATPTRVTGSNYETKEERAARQVLIVRQSSVASAIAALAVGAKSSPSSADVIKYAKEIESYVYGQAQTIDELSDDLDDIPL